MDNCTVTHTEDSKNWPEATISVKLTMNPYLLAMAVERSLDAGVKLWEFINLALWEKLGSPSHDTLLEFAANMHVDDEDPKWKKRLTITARHEVETKEFRQTTRECSGPKETVSDGNGTKH